MQQDAAGPAVSAVFAVSAFPLPRPLQRVPHFVVMGIVYCGTDSVRYSATLTGTQQRRRTNLNLTLQLLCTVADPVETLMDPACTRKTALSAHAVSETSLARLLLLPASLIVGAVVPIQQPLADTAWTAQQPVGAGQLMSNDDAKRQTAPRRRRHAELLERRRCRLTT